MKHTLLYIAALFLLAACQQEELPQGAQALGYLSLSAVEVEAGDVQLISTRASGTDDLMVTLTPTDGDGKLTECPCSETISCQPGTYTLEIYSKNYETDDANAPKYYYEHNEEIEITEGETNEDVKPISVPMINFGVTFSWPTNLEGFTEIKFKVTYGSTSHEMSTGETAYFDSLLDTKKITYTLSAKNADGEDMEIKGSYGNGENETIEAGTIYTVSYQLATRSLEVEK